MSKWQFNNQKYQSYYCSRCGFETPMIRVNYYYDRLGCKFCDLARPLSNGLYELPDKAPINTGAPTP